MGIKLPRRKKGAVVLMRDKRDDSWWHYNESYWEWEPVGVGLIVMGLLVIALGLYMWAKIGR